MLPADIDPFDPQAMQQAELSAALQEEEEVMRQFGPTWWVLFRTKLILVVLWSPVMACGAYWALYQFLAGGGLELSFGLILLIAGIYLVIGLAWSFLTMMAYGELEGWRAMADERWTLTTRAVYRQHPDDPLSTLALDDIQSIHLHYIASLRVRMIDGKAVLMQYVPQRQAVRSAIETQLALATNATVQRPT